MNSKTLTRIVLVLLAGLTIPVSLAAQDDQNQTLKHHHYELIEPATFGGPGSRINGF
jgi:hypothetical protein